ncbi:MAG: bifunctional phosphopantothenoylcysteine decarboxylase/phosphopantothenate--cysteine ligase CoaBC [Gammaproteobacteria bacterium]|nr:bifunctional phosphopantothenoylcysteine decarboxylase/phosphopantothenate--cysteine ligase CoaBC [Gammaproteobacteria bacterium]MBU1601418.1 bifunctional phosphopantothenoylcysteine decarboxylase/phosphopantothenate--cysteine ligase CoaBC [Gammaproteobacteria bacterium]MBU2433613.1 bifunctional phosphopantothenoylcysteine decarboxylase/phosphopantothenate--cysteine ligase CoaBC [Gammaproteobacteria bacterium]MBU2449849.1 bifunctional phosphopantothenoylcysteine decarboxylase/phosphopantothen
MELQGKRVVLGVTGGIAAYKAAELVRLLGKQGAEVQVAMTEGATHFVTATTFQALSGKPVYLDQWDARMPNAMAHIDLSRQADLILVAPASADFLARIAHGMADDLLATMVLARDCPLLAAPAMNRQMWENPATQRNVVQLQADGVQMLGPASGEQACGEVGAGRMLEPEDILEEVIAFFTPKLLAGRTVLITAGPTFEAIDPVRGITNLSSGRMGYAVARAARQAGAQVTLVSGPVGFSAPQGVDRINVRSALDMRAAVMAHAAASDIFIGVAAVADYRVANAAEHKLKKDTGGIPAIELIENPDILAEVAALRDAPFCVGFAAESRNLEEYAQNKRRKKNIPLIAGNLIQEGFGGDSNRLVLFDDSGTHPLTPAPKSVLARQLIEHIANLTRED